MFLNRIGHFIIWPFTKIAKLIVKTIGNMPISTLCTLSS